MTSITLRLTEREKDILNEASDMYGGKVSTMIKSIVFKHLEDEYDLQVIADYEENKKDMKYYSHDEVLKELGL